MIFYNFYGQTKGYDKYYKSLRPKMKTSDCQRRPTTFDDVSEDVTDDGIYVNPDGTLTNCRNVWFQEFWQQHHKCSFDNGTRQGGNQRWCTGHEEIQGYEQEGLVPFVGMCTIAFN